jgi:hypothetical protein
MRLRRSKKQAGGSDAQRAATAATAAGTAAAGRLAEAKQARAEAATAVAEEKRGIIADLRAARQRNNLVALILNGEGR